MTKNNPFRGKIQIFCNNKNNSPKKQISFAVEPEKAKIFQTLMAEFNHIGLSTKDKRKLTLENREEIYKYQNIPHKQIEYYSGKLIDEIKKYGKEKITIHADEAGGHICLAAIFSGKLPSHAKILFEFNDVPVGLFPKKFAKTKSPTGSVELKLQYLDDSWAKLFQKSNSSTQFLNFPKNMKIKNDALKAA